MRVPVRWPALALALALAIAGCGSDEKASSVEPPPAFRHQAFYAQLQDEADAFTIRGGDWLEDYGDAPFYGLAFYGRTAAGASPARVKRADDARARALALVETADFVNGDVNELAMSALGLIDDFAARGDGGERAKLELFIDRLTTLAKTLGWYLETDLLQKSWAFQTYGPTSISALVGLIPAQEALVLGGERKAERIAWAVEMEQHIFERAWNGERFELGGGRQLSCIYPNVAMILLESRLFQLTGEARYRERALATYRGIQPLRLKDDPVRYRSPYSAATMGAKTDDYSTLSSHNYLVLALATLYEITGEADYLLEADSVVDGFANELHGTWCLADRHPEVCAPACGQQQTCIVDSCSPDTCQGGVLHHWMDGRIAIPSDPEFFCSGCNLQLLYALWYRQVGLRVPR